MDLDIVSNCNEVKAAIKKKTSSIVTDEACTTGAFDRPGKTCLRTLEWVWRGQTYMAKKGDHLHVKRQIESEMVDSYDGQSFKYFIKLPKADQLKLKGASLKILSKAFKIEGINIKGSTKSGRRSCLTQKQVELPFKILETQDMVVLYDSLQLAHKCIVSSFYSYGMHKVEVYRIGNCCITSLNHAPEQVFNGWSIILRINMFVML